MSDRPARVAPRATGGGAPPPTSAPGSEGWREAESLVERVDAVVTHVGNSTVQQCLEAGRPMIVIPSGREVESDVDSVTHQHGDDNMTKLEPVVRWVAAILITGAAVSELTRQPTVMTGLETLGYPPTLVWILGPAKLAAVAALLHERAVRGVQRTENDTATHRSMRTT